MKPIRVAIGVVALGLLAAAWWLREHEANEPLLPFVHSPNESTPSAKSALPVATAMATSTISADQVEAATSLNRKSFAEVTNNPLTPAKPAEPTVTESKPGITTNTAGPPKTKAPLVDPLARIALFFVGMDPLAEEVWLDAINNPALPAKERQDLIEDLNEFGLRDPKHPTAEDLPLIVSRMMLIEMVGPDAMDKVNADAFREAYKDLVNLADIAMGGGVPVK